MLDLNVEIATSDSDNKVLLMAMEEEEAKLMGVGGGGKGRGEEAEDEVEHSAGTSDSSSVVNDDESPANAGDENSAAAAAVFDVFKKGKEESPPPSELVTRQFFPVPGGGTAELGLKPPAPAATLRTQWLNLSFAGDSGGESGGQLLARELMDFKPQKPQQVRKSRRGPRSRSSQYRGVTFYRRTGRWESHIWDCGKQVYLGGFDTAYAAARAYDRAAIKFRGVDADINFSVSDYEEDMKQMGNLTKESFIRVLRRQSTGFSRGTSKFRGMGLQKCGQRDARMGEFLGNKAYENSIVQCNRQEAVAGLELGLYDREMVLEATGAGGGGHKLDLSLGIALPSAGDSKRIKATGNYQSRELPMVDCSNASAHKKLLPAWPAAYPFLFPSPEGEAVDKRRAEAPTSSNIGWHMATNGDYGGTSASPAVPRVLPDNAASSGFSSSYSSSNFVIGYNGDPRC